MRGVVFAGGVGMGTGVATVAVPGLIPGGKAVDYAAARGAKFISGGINEMVTAADETTNDEFSEKGIQEVAKGIASNPGDLKDLVVRRGR